MRESGRSGPDEGCTRDWLLTSAPDVARFRPRGTLRSLARQYFLYARGDGKADLWKKRHAIRYATYLGAAALIADGRRHWLPWLLLALGAFAYTRRPYQRLLASAHALPPTQLALAVALVPTIRLVGDVAKMLGYPVGVRWRLNTPAESRSTKPRVPTR